MGSTSSAGGTLIISFWLVQNLEFQYVWGFSQNELFFLSNEDIVDNFWGHHKIGLVSGVNSMHFMVFFKVNVQNGDIFGGCYNFEYF